MKARWWLWALIALQAGATGVFLWDLIATIFGLRAQPVGWQTRELIEIGAALGLTAGLIIGVMTLHRAWARTERAEAGLRAASGAFMEVVEDRFAEWQLTAAERDVALFALKGMNLSEIAGLRGASEGTVKAQTAAIYRKAGVSGRPQLISLFVEDLLDVPPSD